MECDQHELAQQDVRVVRDALTLQPFGAAGRLRRRLAYPIKTRRKAHPYGAHVAAFLTEREQQT